MASHRGLPLWARQSLRCPVCGSPLAQADKYDRCVSAICGTSFPVIDGVPVLINEERSVFALADFEQQRGTFFFPRAKRSRVKRTLTRLVPNISANVTGRRNYATFAESLLRHSPAPRVLVLGGGVLGAGMEALVAHRAIEVVETDVAFGPRTTVVCDAHDIPFADESFDGVVVQAVLEHVVDPYRCVDEVHRVLKDAGFVYAETPFMQQVHGGPYDFTRFTHLGHRRLFRRFTEVDSGAVCGPGMALAWSYQYLLLSFARARWVRSLIRLFVAFTAFHWKYLDYLVIERAGTLDAASGYYFLGRKSDRVLSDRELLRLYRGAQVE